MAREKACFEINRMARLLEVSRSGYYAWSARQHRCATVRQVKRHQLDIRVRMAHALSRGTYGAPRVTAQLARERLKVNRKTVASSMVRQQLQGAYPARFKPATTIPGTSTGRVWDRVHRNWDTGRLNAVWVSDITYLATRQGWLYLAAVTDAHSRRIIGWAIDSTMTTDLVAKALRMAVTLRGGQLPTDVILHADRGCQYLSGQLHQVCEQLGLLQSVGRTGVCWDNAMAESIWATLKTEFYSQRTWATRSEARQAVGCWIESWYNRRRLHSAIGYKSPVEYEQGMIENTASVIAVAA